MRSAGTGGPDGDGQAPRRQGLEARIADTLATHLVESGFSEALMEKVLVALQESRDLERLVVRLLGEPGVNGSVDGMVDRQLGRVLDAVRKSDEVRALVREQVDAYVQHLTLHPEPIRQILAALQESRDLERLVVHLLAEPGVNGSVDGMVDRQLGRVLEALRKSEEVRELVREQVDAYLQHLTLHPEPVRQLIQDQSRGMVEEMLASVRARALLADDAVDGWVRRLTRKA